jgi:alginate O-acetyltransferase complex protein AlgI
MLFNSIEFLIFFPAVVIIYFLLKEKYRNLFLLLASCYFYMAFIPAFMIIIAFTTVIVYVGSRLIGHFEDKRTKKLVFLVVIITNILTIVVFKYLGFFGDTINFFGTKIGLAAIIIPKIALPLGISFHTFQAMGYLIDVYRGDEEPEKNFVTYAVFLMYFPQLVAGPIERAHNLISQFKYEHFITYEGLSLGGRMMLWGMFKKVVVADNLSTFVDNIYNNVTTKGTAVLWVGIVFFAIQIYCDFSGYSDIAIGAANIMGFKLMRNFDTPYYAASVTDFWRRWHISLSTWFRDYIYIPLGGNRVSKKRWCLNQLITMSISGIWHGANWTYVVWGLLNGVYLVIGRLTSDIRKKIKEVTHYNKIPFFPTFIGTVFTFFIICMTWIFFRAKTFGDAFYIIHQVTAYAPDFSTISGAFNNIAPARLIISFGAIILLLAVDFFCRGSDFKTAVGKLPAPARIVSYGLLLAIIVLFGAYDNKAFIYFQF